MAVLHSIQSGNFTSASTWGVVDSTSYLDTRLSTSNISTSVNSSASFIPGAITISGVSIQLSGRVGGATSATMTVRLFNITDGVIVQDVTINVSDLPDTTSSGTPYIGWTYFKFPSNTTLIAGKSYNIRIFGSATNSVSIYRDGTANNFSRALVTTTTAAPAATDVTIISGEHTSGGVNTMYTVTMDNTSNAVSFGSIYLGAKATLSYDVAASTNYRLKVAGNIYIGQGGTWNQGIGLPSTSTAWSEIECASALQYSMFVYGTCSIIGRTLSFVRTKLAADVSAGATTATLTDNTGWGSCTVALASTTRTATQHEIFNAGVTGTTMTMGALINAHGGNASTFVQADVIILVRNVKFQSTNTSFRTNIQVFPRATVDFQYAEFYEVGTGATTANAGIAMASALTTGSINFQYNSMWSQNAAQGAINFISSTNVTFSNNNIYRFGIGAVIPVTIPIIDDNNTIMGNTGTTSFCSCTLIGSGNIFTSNTGQLLTNGFKNGAINTYYYSNGGTFNLSLPSALGNVGVSNFYNFRNNGNGITINGSSAYTRDYVMTWSNIISFGNNGQSIVCSGRFNVKLHISDSYFYGGTTLVGTSLFGPLSVPVDSIYFTNSYFGYSDNSLTSSPFSSAVFTSLTNGTLINFFNCYFNTEFIPSAGLAITGLNCTAQSFNHNGVAGSYRQWLTNGVISSDTVIFNTASPSIRITPSTSAYKAHTNNIKVPVASGQSVTVTIKVRKSVVGDGTAYGGNQPRLMLSFNSSCGIMAETVCATMTVANGVWETLSYTSPIMTNDAVLDFYVDCDGTTGWINIDDFTSSSTQNTKGTRYWSNMGTYIESTSGSGGTVGSTFLS